MGETWDAKQIFLTLVCLNCGKTRTMAYDRYRKLTGICEVCQRPFKEHLRCSGCGILIGLRHTYHLTIYRGVSLCHLCIKSWKELEKDLRHQKKLGKKKELTWKAAQLIWYPKQKTIKGKTRNVYNISKGKPVDLLHAVEPADIVNAIEELYPEMKKGLEERRKVT